LVDLSHDELRIVVGVLVNRYASADEQDTPAKDNLRSALSKLAWELGYPDGWVNAAIVKAKLSNGKIKL